jgi:hypothetical protein
VRSTAASVPWRPVLGLALLAWFLCLSTTIQAAHADTTHPYLGQLTLEGGGEDPVPVGVDADGNLLIWFESQQAVRKFSPTGQEVDFSALDSNMLDGAGGLHCETTPADCDRVPQNGFGVPFPDSRYLGAAVDQSDGPAAGYIYVSGFYDGSDAIHVFDATGRYKGEIDQTKTFPWTSPNHGAGSVAVTPSGGVLIGFGELGYHLDKYVPTDGNPANYLFVGQVRSAPGPEVFAGGFAYGIGDDTQVYTRRSQIPEPAQERSYWRKYTVASMQLPVEETFPLDFSPTGCHCGEESGPFKYGGIEPGLPGGFNAGSVDPRTGDVYLFNSDTRHVQQWSPDNEKIGPTFGDTVSFPNPFFPTEFQNFAFDTSGTATDGRIYARSGPSTLAVFGPPVVIPDISGISSKPGHHAAEVTATLGTAGAGPITSCAVEYGTDPTYGSSAPCTPAPPYADGSQISAFLPGLSVETDYHYRIVTENENGANRSDDNVVHTVAVLDVSTGDAVDLTETTATFTGKLDADGLPTEYHFEYGIDKSYRSSTPLLDAGSDTGTVSVPPVAIEGLQPGRRYHYRLVASNALGTTYGNGREFLAPSPPTLSGVQATDVGEASARLNARINPGGFETTYRFEYGPTTSYGASVPIPAASVGDGTVEKEVHADLGNLTPGVTYHFRLVATNKWGTTVGEDTTFDFFPPSCPNAYVRQQTGANYLPDCRAYELVSPGNAGAVQLLPGAKFATFKRTQIEPLAPYWRLATLNQLGLATGPSRFGFLGSLGAVAGTDPANTLLDAYVATRTISGWKTTMPGLKGSEVVLRGGVECSASMHRCIDYDLGDLTSGDPSDKGSSAPFLWSIDGTSLGRLPTNLHFVENGQQAINDDRLSADFSHYIFTSNSASFAKGGLTTSPGSVYDNDIRNASVAILSKSPGGGNLEGDASPIEKLRIADVSHDGSHVLMESSSTTGTSHLYMRVNGAVTYDVSRANGINLTDMTADGSKVIFSTIAQVTPDDTDASVDLYAWREETDSVARISKGNGNGDTDACLSTWTSGCSIVPVTTERPDVDDVIASAAGDVYFYSPEQLDSENPGVADERNLYVFRDGDVKYVTTLDAGTAINRLQVSPDGERAAFLTASRVTGYDNDGWRQMYMFAADSATIRCASCLPNGDPPSILHEPLHDPDGELLGPASGDVLASHSGRFMADDGRIAFTTSDALVERDTNELLDVYEFVDGRAQLISSGTSQRDRSPSNLTYTDEYVGLEAFSADGTDLYFSTLDTLVPEDLNGTFVKFYVARTNGGFPISSAIQPCVAADECHGPDSSAPAPAQIGTGANLGTGGNLTAAQRKTRAARKAQRKKRRSSKRKRASKLKVKATGARG